MKKLLIALLSLSLLASCGTADTPADDSGSTDTSTSTTMEKYLEMDQAKQVEVMTAITQAAATDIQELATTVTDPMKMAEETQKIMKKVAEEKYPNIDFGTAFDTPVAQ